MCQFISQVFFGHGGGLVFIRNRLITKRRDDESTIAALLFYVFCIYKYLIIDGILAEFELISIGKLVIDQ